MTRTYQITVTKAANGFIVVSPTREQHIAKDETELQKAVADVVTEMLKMPDTPVARNIGLPPGMVPSRTQTTKSVPSPSPN